MNTKLIAAYQLAKRDAAISAARLEDAKKNPADYTAEEVIQRKKEADVDTKKMNFLQSQLKSEIANIEDMFSRRLAEDHYLRGEKISQLASRYSYSEDTIKKYLKKARRKD